MEQRITINENGLHLTIEVAKDKDVRLLHFSALPFDESLIPEEDARRAKFRLLELQATHLDHADHHGSKHTGTMPGKILAYASHTDSRNAFGRKLEIAVEGGGLRAVSHIQMYDGIPVVRSWTEVTNTSEAAQGLEYVSSFALTGISKEGLLPNDDKCRLHIPHNTWCGECQWKSYTPLELGLAAPYEFSLKRISASNTGTWSTGEFLPMGCLENTECSSALVWQIEHNGSWNWELSDATNHLYLQLSGPSENENHWWKELKPGETFVTVPVAVGSVAGGLEEAIRQLTRYRRVIRRKSPDNQNLPVIFNDFMNCLFGNPSTEKLMPLIDAAADVGCEYFCIDAGWYADGSWWNNIGEFQPSLARFPNGIMEPLDYIRSKGMIAGLWLEPEVMGTKCPLAAKVPDNWFFVRHGKRIIDHGRYQLDFRNPEVLAHVNEVVDRLVREYGVGYIKLDYNINAGLGTEIDADSFGDGLLQYNRAYLSWLDGVLSRHPEVVIENCASGGMRMDYAMLSRLSLQSSSDQPDYKKYAPIAAAVASAVASEQCAAWSYPTKDGDEEETIFNMVNSLLMRIHLSGNLADLSNERLALVKEGLDYYRSMRREIPNSLPFWPLGLSSFSDKWFSAGLDCGKKSYVAVWRLGDTTDTCRLPIKRMKGKSAKVTCAYPVGRECSCTWNQNSGTLTVRLPVQNSARIFEIEEA